MSTRVLEGVGIDIKKDIKQERLGVAESVNAMKDRKIDAFTWVGGVPTAAITDLAATPGIKIKLVDHSEAVDAMNKKYGPSTSRVRFRRIPTRARTRPPTTSMCGTSSSPPTR